MKTILCALLLIGCNLPSSQPAQLHESLAKGGGSASGCPNGYEPNPDFDPTSDDPEWECILTGEGGSSTSSGGIGSFNPGGSSKTDRTNPCTCSVSYRTCSCSGKAECDLMTTSGRCRDAQSSCRIDRTGYHCTCPSTTVSNNPDFDCVVVQ